MSKKRIKCFYPGCDKDAVCRWPAIDPDIPSHPYCREHVEELKMKAMMEIYSEGGDRE